MRGSKAGVAGSVLVGVLSLCGIVSAQPDDVGSPDEAKPPIAAADDPSGASDERARELFRRGDQRYANGEYEEALGDFRAAHELSGRQGLLFNMANALEKLGRDAEALEALEAYLPHAPEARRAEVESRIAALRERVGETPPPPEPPPPEPPAPKPPTPVAAPEPTPPVTPAPIFDTPTPTSRVAGYVLLGAGGAGVVLGAVFGGMALSARGDAEDACPEVDGQRRCLVEAADALDDDDTFSLASDVSFGVGIAAGLLGAGLVIHSFMNDESETASLTLTTGPSGGEVRTVVRF